MRRGQEHPVLTRFSPGSVRPALHRLLQNLYQYCTGDGTCHRAKPLTFIDPSAEFVKQATISGMDAYKALCAEAEKDYTGFWARLAREHVALEDAVHAGARRVQRAVLQVVCRWHLERFV
jgi:hypothetical protein